MKPTLLHAIPLSGLAMLSMFASGCSDSDESAQPTNSNSSAPTTVSSFKKPSERYTLRPTDVLRVEIYQEPDFKPEVSVSQEGDVVLPLIGKMQIAGLTVNEAQQKLSDQYRAFYKEPQLSILILKYAERKVHVDGMVGRAGPVIFPPEESLTIMRAIAAAGGILPRGERNDVRLKRVVNGRETTMIIDTADISSGKAPDIELKENDYIYVRDSRI
jgi:polysaccharide export outer membrane protein